MRASHWWSSFHTIGVTHLGRAAYEAAFYAGREFMDPRNNRYVFYSLEIARIGGPATLHRNHALVGATLNELSGQPRYAPTGPKMSSVDAARLAARRVISDLDCERS